MQPSFYPTDPAPHSFTGPDTSRPNLQERMLPRDLATSGTLPGTTDIAINDNRVFISGRNRAFVVNDAAGAAIVKVGLISGSTYGLSATNATLVTPTIASFVNAQHDHTSAAQGGLLPASGSVTLLKANSGTDTNTVATNLDTYAISGLTAKDSLYAEFNVYAVTQAANAGNLSLVSSTDSNTVLITPVAATVTATSGAFGVATIRQSQSGATTLQSLGWGGQDAGSLEGRSRSPAVTTAWTGSWTIALRYPGMVAGGTLEWSWALYKIAGQE